MDERGPLAVRSAEGADVLAMTLLHLRAATSGYRDIFPADAPALTREMLEVGWRGLVLNERAEILVAVIASEVVGTVVLEQDDLGSWWLKRLHVDPDRWGQGIGSALHDEAVAAAWRRGAEQLNLWVLEQNDRARQMYERRSWSLVPGRTLANDPPGVIDVLYTRDVIPTAD